LADLCHDALLRFARIDENSDGALSLEELQAAYPQQ